MQGRTGDVLAQSVRSPVLTVFGSRGLRLHAFGMALEKPKDQQKRLGKAETMCRFGEAKTPQASNQLEQDVAKEKNRGVYIMLWSKPLGPLGYLFGVKRLTWLCPLEYHGFDPLCHRATKELGPRKNEQHTWLKKKSLKDHTFWQLFPLPIGCFGYSFLSYTHEAIRNIFKLLIGRPLTDFRVSKICYQSSYKAFSSLKMFCFQILST